MPALNNIVHFHELPEIIIFNIFSMVSDIRTRNTMSLVCLKWCSLERSTRISLALRGNIRNLLCLPTCFRAVTNLDISFLSPWGHELLDESRLDSVFLAQIFRHAFPSVVSLTIYSRNPSTLALFAPQWPNLRHVKLIRWHQQMSAATLGADFLPLLEHCPSLSSLDLSHFCCYPEDLPPALQAYPIVAASLSHLNILNNSSGEGYKSHELLAITSACKNLRQLLATCIFDNRFTGFTGDETLLSLASNCPLLSLLHLIDATSFSYEDAKVLSHATIIELCAGLPFLEELVLDVFHNGASMELLNAKCPRLKSLTLGKFHGVCSSVLESLCIKNSPDLTDSGLIGISLGCPRLTKFEVEGCKRITEMGMRKLASNLGKTLIDVKISCCKHLNAVCSLRALGPIQDLIHRLHIDCVWESVQELQGEDTSLKKKCNNGNGNRVSASMSWEKLHYLSLWIPVNQLLIPLTLVGLEDCPALEEIQIRIEGDVKSLLILKV